MAELVLGERADRDVLLEDRPDPGPLGVAEADDELVVGHRQQEQRERPLAAVAGAREIHRDRLVCRPVIVDPLLRLRLRLARLPSRAAASLSRIT